jgi:rhamnose transport system substrate-binding protein
MLNSMSDMLGGQGDFAILSSTQTAVNQNAWIADMKERLKTDPAFAKLKLVDVVYGEEKADVSANRAKELVTTYPNLKGIIIPAGISLPAAATALEASGDLGRVKLTGLAPASLIRKFIKDGNVQDIWWNVTDLGYLTTYAARALACDETSGATGDSFDAGTLGAFKVDENGVVILGPSKIVTPENVDQFAF